MDFLSPCAVIGDYLRFKILKTNLNHFVQKPEIDCWRRENSYLNLEESDEASMQQVLGCPISYPHCYRAATRP